MDRPRWKVFDFDANWTEFWQAWNDDEVQEVLAYDMENWCEFHAPRNPDGSAPTWRYGDPLWHLGRADFWDDVLEPQIDARLLAMYPDPYRCYKRTMQAQHLPVLDKHKFNEAIMFRVWESEYDKLRKELEPKPGTLESLVLIQGKNYLTWALAFTASIMFPDSDIIIARNARGDMFTLLPKEGIVFDLLDFYMHKYQGVRRRQYSRMKFRFFADIN